jgi:hypothetical protein
MSQPLSSRLQTGLCFFPHPAPAMLSMDFTVHFPRNKEHNWLSTFRVYTMHGLGSASPPVVLLSASGELRTPEPTTYPLVKLLSIFSLLWITTFNSDSHSLAIPCFALAPHRLMLAVVISPHGLITALMGVATLSQTHLIQSGRALGAEPQVRSSFRESLRLYTRLSVSHQSHPHQWHRASPRWVMGCL